MSEIEHYIAPKNLASALEEMAAGAVTLVAGGTDLTPQINEGRRSYAPTLINIRHIAGLSGISEADGHIRLGCLATVSEIRE